MSSSGQIDRGADERTAIISGLIPERVYNVGISTRNTDDNFSPANAVLVVSTAAAPPDGPTDPADLNVAGNYATTPNDVKLLWVEADANGGAPIDFYRITWDPPYGGVQPQVVSNDGMSNQSTFIADLYANSRYTFKIDAVNEDGVASPGYAKVIAATASNVGPQDPRYFQTSYSLPSTGSTVYLEWDTADTLGGATLSDYYITWQPPDGTGSTRAGKFDTTKAVTGLSASTTYSFNIVAVDTSGNDSPGNYYVSGTTTAEGGLQRPTNFRVLSVSVSSITLGWNPAIATAPDVLRSNVIEAFDLSGDFYVPYQTASGGSTSNYVFTNLSSNTAYRFELLAYSDSSNAASLNTPEGTTSSPGAPFDPSLNIVTESYQFITLDWTLSGDGRNGGANLSGFYIDYFETPDGEVLRRTGLGADASTATIFNLTPNTEYSFTIYAQNLSGFTSPGSGNATKIGNTLAAGAPYAPSNVQAHPYIPATPSSISVMWNSAYKGSPTNSAVTNHIVRISPANLSGNASFDVGEDTTITISNMDEYTAYQVWVKAINANGGIGNESAPIYIATPPNIGPQDAVGLRTNGVVTDDTIPIAWASSGDPLDGPPILGYRVYYSTS
jgi:chitodextrinase